MAGSIDGATPLVLVTAWRRRGKVWGAWERDIVGAEGFYVTALQRAGTSPVLAPVGIPGTATSLLSRMQGLLVIGGEDLHTDVTGADPATVGSNALADRDRWEIELLDSALDLDLPVLAICRGMQLLNVARGGTLHVDISGSSDVHPPVPEDIDEALAYRHDVSLMPGSLLARTYGAHSKAVNSLHHQAIDRVGHDLTVTARAADGSVEAIEPAGSSWCAAMQWHPELLPDDAAEASLFHEFAERCGA